MDTIRQLKLETIEKFLQDNPVTWTDQVRGKALILMNLLDEVEIGELIEYEEKERQREYAN